MQRGYGAVRRRADARASPRPLVVGAIGVVVVPLLVRVPWCRARIPASSQATVRKLLAVGPPQCKRSYGLAPRKLF